jgi:SPRY domain-containing protein
MADTVRPVADLISLLFADNQQSGSITEQDVRDAIVSISLETLDLSGLPRDSGGLNVGRLWLDNTKILRVVTQFQPLLIMDHAATLGGAGGLAADARLPGAQLWSGASAFGGVGGLAASAIISRATRATFLGITSLSASPTQRQSARSQLSGSGGLSSTNRLLRRALASLPGSGSISGDATPSSGQQWGTVNSNITKSNSNLTITRTANDGVWGAAKSTRLKTSGKWYWEVHIDTYTNVHLGIGNSSVSTSDGADLGGDTNSFQYYTFEGAGGVVINGAWQASPDPFGTGSIVSFALDMSSGWWARVNGGTWAGFNGGSGDPATNNNPIPISLITTTGGLGPVAALAWVGDGVTLRMASSSWSFSAPSGFGQM